MFIYDNFFFILRSELHVRIFKVYLHNEQLKDNKKVKNTKNIAFYDRGTHDYFILR